MSKAINKVVLAYSGGLDTSAIIPWLKETYACEVVAFVADVGQDKEELIGIEDKAIQSGASECHVVDLKAQLVTDYIFPMLKTGSIYESQYLLGTSIARPIIAKAQVAIARQTGADAVAHGCTGKGNDQVRFEACFAALAPDLQVIAPWREWDLVSRPQLLDYLATRNIPCSASATKIYSRDANLWHISHEGGELEDPWQAPSDQVWTWTNAPEQAPDQAEHLQLSFAKGELVSVNGQALSPLTMVELLNQKGALHGIGRIDIVENRLVGIKSRGCYETPGGTILFSALQAIESLVLDKESLKYRQQLALEMSHLIYDGRWFTPLCKALLTSAESFSEQLTGDVVVKLYKGQVSVQQRRSPFSLYSQVYASFDDASVYDHKDAEGFIRLYSLASRIRATQVEEAE